MLNKAEHNATNAIETRIPLLTLQNDAEKIFKAYKFERKIIETGQWTMNWPPHPEFTKSMTVARIDDTAAIELAYFTVRFDKNGEATHAYAITQNGEMFGKNP